MNFTIKTSIKRNKNEVDTLLFPKLVFLLGKIKKLNISDRFLVWANETVFLNLFDKGGFSFHAEMSLINLYKELVTR